MMLKAKIKPKYLDHILEGKKMCEFREIEGMELTDGERTVTFDVTEIDLCDEPTRQAIQMRYPDVRLTDKKYPLARIWLGKQIKK